MAFASVRSAPDRCRGGPMPRRLTSLTSSTIATGASEQATMTTHSEAVGGTVWSTRRSSGTRDGGDLEQDADEHRGPEPAVREQPGR